ncbi:SpoIIE family protein phosphatase [Nocardioides sp. zg-536]|uniref:histidine kinase n=1 Tax=Nocardioides faecalis TaxID=2803858 RepID=A0A939BZR3_9ACTN|nr:SpoIIE family protein phosphatase [Nocardioides faecalis]MBM9461578.1 SpoIIE family protein phosphatase [Nocardioides faecalis]QVI57788.1 SpoIIE family protein phosphatase [Nocardioides faecalis]
MHETLRAGQFGPGQVGADLARVDWAATEVGPPEQWPPLLRTTVRTLLGSQFPMWMAWGPSLTFFCNDAYRRDTLGTKYPWALGRPASEVWSEIWDEIGPRLSAVMDEGASTWDEKLMLILMRSGYAEETYHTFSYSPLLEDDGSVAGMLCVVREDTDEVIANRRIRALRDLAGHLTAQLSERETVQQAAQALSANSRDLPFHLAYLYDDDGTAHLVGNSGLPAGHPAAPETIPAPAPAPAPASGAEVRWAPAQDGTTTVVSLDPQRHGELPGGSWPVPPAEVAVVSVTGAQGAPYGFLVVGLNPYRPFDTGYRDFLELLAGRLGAAITDARAYEMERRRAESLAELDRAKTDFFTNVSHEFRTPLTLLLGPAEDALADTAEPLGPHQRDRVEVIHRSGLRLLKLVNSLLDFSRLEAGRMAERFEPVDLASYTRQLTSIFDSAAQRLGLELTTNCAPLDEPVYVDPDLWGKVVLNLVSNALKFTLEGGITVSLVTEDGHAVLRVSDTGVGIPPEEQTTLFRRFRRVRGVQGRSHEGSGIGLALVAEVATLHGGDVDVLSTPGVGSTFVVRVPLGAAHLPEDLVAPSGAGGVADVVLDGFRTEAHRLSTAAPGAPQAHDATPAAAGGEDRARILVVDDNADIRQYVAELLEPHYDVVTAGDGRAALEAARTRPPHLVLSDVMMPVMDGFELLAALRADPDTVGIPVVMLSARGGDEATAQGLEAGADDYLAKPFGARELLARVRANLELDRTTRTRRELERSRRLLDDAERLARMGSWSVDLETGRVEVSAQLLRLIGLSHAEVDDLGHPDFLIDLVDPGDRDFVRVVLGEARVDDQIAFEVRMSRSDGSGFYAHVNGEVVAEEDGAVLRCSLQDVTERRRTAEAVVAANAAAEAAAREHAIADELQTSLLPERSFDLKQLEVATYYRAGSEGTKVGGDWYDVIELDDGRTGLVLGDVMGHGVQAAAVMGQIRTAVRAYARLGMPPLPLMESLDSLVWDLFPEQIVTCVYAAFDPESLTVDLVSAGHLPPVLIDADGTVQRLQLERHPPLGVGRRFVSSQQVRLAPGAGIVLYTDGLVERRGRDLEDGITSLMEQAAALRVPLAEIPEALVHGMLADAPEDDVAILVARIPRTEG